MSMVMSLKKKWMTNMGKIKEMILDTWEDIVDFFEDLFDR